jgi:CO/xanthine dehydrogenase Mo-binding subunit/DNA-binding CsgD family transcriptional regulator
MVRLTVTRGQMFTSCGHREEQEQHIQLGATREGKLTAIRHRKISVTSPFDDWAEPAFGVAPQLYASPAYEGVHRLVRGNTMTPTFTRGPGEAAGVFTLECAMDELASQLQVDPVELRLRNLAEADPNTGNPWSSYGLRECLQRGASRIGWEHRNPAPRSERDGNWLIGTGMAVAAYPVAFFMRTQRAIARDALGDPAAAERALERALDLAEPDGARFFFLIHPAPRLLERHAGHRTAHASLAAEILGLLAGRRPAPPPGGPRPPLEPLSESEIRVLRYLPTNLSTPEIANELYVTVNTVRTHVRHLYAKLGTHTRAEAVARARGLGLLAPSARRC